MIAPKRARDPLVDGFLHITAFVNERQNDYTVNPAFLRVN